MLPPRKRRICPSRPILLSIESDLPTWPNGCKTFEASGTGDGDGVIYRALYTPESDELWPVVLDKIQHADGDFSSISNEKPEWAGWMNVGIVNLWYFWMRLMDEDMEL
jgi:hypothetical protein